MAPSVLALNPLPSPDASSDEEFDFRGTAAAAAAHGAPTDDVVRYERKLGDSELSYYLPSRANGVNDMYLHLGFTAPDALLHVGRVRAVWAIMRMRHPLLAAKVVMRDYDDVRFVYTPPASVDDALADADKELKYKFQTKEDLIEAYLNGPRLLSTDRLSYLIVSRTPTPDAQLPTPPHSPLLAEARPAPEARTSDYSLFICAAHSIGDGMALHAFANDFFGLLGGGLTQGEMDALVVDEWAKRWGSPAPDRTPLPPSMEDRLPHEPGRLRNAVARVDFQNELNKQIGGQSFPRRADKTRHTVVPTVAFDAPTTAAILKKCKAHGVTIASALFAICNVAWARMSPRAQHALPMMMYAAMNVRPCLAPSPPNDSYWFLAVGYFNVILPNFLPPAGAGAQEKTFWHRARSAKAQCARAAKTPLLAARNRQMALKRGAQSRAWAREDDARDAGTWVAPPPAPPPAAESSRAPAPPSVALMGLSMLGNLDAVYKHAAFPAVAMHTLTTGSRQRHSGMLLFGYTFAGKLWVSLGYDENGFDQKTLDVFWAGVNAAMDELLVGS